MSLKDLISGDLKDDTLDTSFILDDEDVLEDDHVIFSPVKVPEGYKRVSDFSTKNEDLVSLTKDDLVYDESKDDDFKPSSDDEEDEDIEFDE